MSNKNCENFCPPEYRGRWRDWHRGSGCSLDDGKQRTAAGAEEIAALGVDHPAVPRFVAKPPADLLTPEERAVVEATREALAPNERGSRLIRIIDRLAPPVKS